MLSVCQTTIEAADCIRRHSFAVVRADAGLVLSLEAARTSALSYLSSLGQQDDDASSLARYQVIHKGHLFGFNEPSSAKYLFRAYMGHELQPWPNEELRQASQEVARGLHALLMDCWKHLTVDDICTVDSRDCPLDYFYYHGRNNNAVNCSEHVDRGVLICVCLDKTPGLEVYSREKDAFLCPREEVGEEEEINNNGALICILAGDSLRRFCNVPACAHRVRNSLPRPRLSISYELRIIEGDS